MDSAEVSKVFMSARGGARFRRLLWDDDIKTLYFEDWEGSIVECWLNPSEDRGTDFGIWSNNSLNNASAVVLWEDPPVNPTVEGHGWAIRTCKFPSCDCDLPKEG